MNLPKFKIKDPGLEETSNNGDGTGTFQHAEPEAVEIVYTIKETIEYDNYVIVEGMDGVSNGGTITNKQVRVDLELQKRDSDNKTKPLAGAKFKIYTKDATTGAMDPVTDADGEPVVFTTREDGSADIGTFVMGTYYLEEIEAPAGYMIEPQLIPFTLSYDKEKGEVTISYHKGVEPVNEKVNPDSTDVTLFNSSVTVLNHSGVTLPSTGGMGTSVFGIAGVGIIALAVIMLLKKRMEMVED